MSSDLPESLLQFVRVCIPTYQAAEVLLFLAANSDRDFSPAEIVVSMRPVVVTGSAVEEYVSHFVAKGLVAEAGQSDPVRSIVGLRVRYC